MLFCSAFLHQTANQQVTNFISPDIQETKDIQKAGTELLHIINLFVRL